MNEQSVRFVVSGRVQGVFYRAAAEEQAGRLGLSGWVRNLEDGRVELLARGSDEALEQLAAWLWQGPPAARVSGVAVEECRDAIEPGFRVRR